MCGENFLWTFSPFISYSCVMETPLSLSFANNFPHLISHCFLRYHFHFSKSMSLQSILSAQCLSLVIHIVCRHSRLYIIYIHVHTQIYMVCWSVHKNIILHPYRNVCSYAITAIASYHKPEWIMFFFFTKYIHCTYSLPTFVFVKMNYSVACAPLYTIF